MDGENIYTNRTFELFSGLGYQILRMPNNSVTKRMGYLVPGVYLGFIVWGRSPEWPKARNFLVGSGETPPAIFSKSICAGMQSGAFETQF